jgi:exonuclease III
MDKIKFLQINTARSFNSITAVSALIQNKSIDIACIQEPYTKFNKVQGFPIRYNVFFRSTTTNPRQRSCIVLRPNKSLSHIFHFNLSTPDIAVLEIRNNKKRTILVSVYIPPTENIDQYLHLIQNILNKFPKEAIIITGDFNGHSALWGGLVTDGRGNKIEDFIFMNSLQLMNSPDDFPTFMSNYNDGVRESWIDLTCVKKS